MASVTLKFRGMDELRAALRALPEELTDDARKVIADAANAAAAQVIAAYPVGPGDDEHEGGNLKAGVKVEEKQAGRWGVAYRVRSTARHAHLYEWGTQTRQTKIWRAGANRGAMPGKKVFVPTMIRSRRSMIDRLIGILESKGLLVNGRG